MFRLKIAPLYKPGQYCQTLKSVIFKGMSYVNGHSALTYNFRSTLSENTLNIYIRVLRDPLLLKVYLKVY